MKYVFFLFIFHVCQVHAVEVKHIDLINNTGSDIVKMSPDSNYYYKVELTKESKVLSLHSTQDLNVINQIDLMAMFGDTFFLRQIDWIDNQFVLIQLTHELENKTSLIEANLKNRIYIIDVTNSKNTDVYTLTTPGFLVHTAVAEEGVFYYARSSAESKVYRINVEKLLKKNQKRSKLMRKDGGQFVDKNVIAQVEGYVTKWFFNLSGKPESALHYDEQGALNLATISHQTKPEDVSDTQTKIIKVWTKDALNNEDQRQLLLPIDSTDKPNEFYALDVSADEFTALYQVNYLNDEATLIYESNGLEIEDIIYNTENQIIGVILLSEGRYQYRYFDQKMDNASQEDLNIIIQQSVDANIKLIYQEAHNYPAHFYLERGNNKQKIHQKMHTIDAPLQSLQYIDYVKQDDYNIQYIVNMPKTSLPSYPLIVLPHGGPFGVHDTPYFDSITQFFVQNGFAVLRVNFRGSSGFGVEFRDAGKKQWGGKILDDIRSAIDAVIKRPDIQNSNICAVGMSYGGYAALTLGLESPNQFSCIISVAGVMDLPLQIKSDYLSNAQVKWTKEWIGSHTNEYDSLFEISPISKLNLLNVPLLLIHGEKDTIVDVEHGYRAHHILNKYDIDHRFETYPESNHHFSNEEERVIMFNLLIEFLNEHLK